MLDVKILDSAGGFDDELARGEVGEIAISEPSLATGYRRDADLTAQRFRGAGDEGGDADLSRTRGVLPVVLIYPVD